MVNGLHQDFNVTQWTYCQEIGLLLMLCHFLVAISSKLALNSG